MNVLSDPTASITNNIFFQRFPNIKQLTKYIFYQVSLLIYPWILAINLKPPFKFKCDFLNIFLYLVEQISLNLSDRFKYIFSQIKDYIFFSGSERLLYYVYSNLNTQF